MDYQLVTNNFYSIWTQDLAIETSKKVQAHCKDVRDVKAMVKCVIPSNWINKLYYKLQRSNVKNENEDDIS